MDNIFQNEEKIKIFAQIQSNLTELDVNPDDTAIDNIIDQIPQAYLNQKEDLMMICQLFAYYSRIVPAIKKKNALKLFERIMGQIKEQLKDESSFFWNIFGGLFYFKLWMYEEGLITIEYIILSSQNDTSFKTIEYFLPEIIEKQDELFEKELQYQFKIEYTNESIQKFKELRKKHFKWIKESGDFHDPIYREIETNRLRLALKTDDIDTFQKILSETNMSINAKIYESTLENFLRFPIEISLIEFAIEFNSINIFKFLIMNDAKFDNQMNFIAVKGRNYEIIHLLESKNNKEFSFESFISAISCWNDEMKEYIMNNYDYDFLEKSEVNDSTDNITFRMIDQIFFSSDFMFLQSIFLPFLRKNPRFLKENINEIVAKTFSDNSGFFLREILKYPKIKVDYNIIDTNENYLLKAIHDRNANAVNILLNNPYKNFDKSSESLYVAFVVACKFDSDIKIIEMICNQENFDINFSNIRFGISTFFMVVMSGNIPAIKYIIDRFPNSDNINFVVIFNFCLEYRHLYSLKLLMKFYLDLKKDVSIEQIIEQFRQCSLNHTSREEFVEDLKNVYLELTSS